MSVIARPSVCGRAIRLEPPRALARFSFTHLAENERLSHKLLNYSNLRIQEGLHGDSKDPAKGGWKRRKLLP